MGLGLIFSQSEQILRKYRHGIFSFPTRRIFSKNITVLSPENFFEEREISPRIGTRLHYWRKL